MKQRTLRTVRKAMGLTVTDVAKSAGLEKSIVSRLDRCLRQPSYDTVVKLEKGLRLKRGTLTFPKPTKDVDQGAAA